MCILCVSAAAIYGINFITTPAVEFRGVQLPTRGSFTLEENPRFEVNLNDWTWEHDEPIGLFHGFVFSREDGYRALNGSLIVNAIPAATRLKAKSAIRHSKELPLRTPKGLLERLYHDFNRPMIGDATRIFGVKSVGIFKRGKILFVQGDSSQGMIPSIMDGLDRIYRLANEGVISWNDKNRLDQDILDPNLGIPNATPSNMLRALHSERH